MSFPLIPVSDIIRPFDGCDKLAVDQKCSSSISGTMALVGGALVIGALVGRLMTQTPVFTANAALLEIVNEHLGNTLLCVNLN